MNRAALIKKIHRVLKKRFKPAPADPNRTLLEHLLLAAVLENSTPDAAEKVTASMKERFFDLNEVRVSTVRELAEVMQPLTDPQDSAVRLKTILQSVFESLYSFDLEYLKKQNIGQAVKRLEKFEGVTPFCAAYVTQAALGGHSIPLSQGTLVALTVLGVSSEADAQKGRVPGLERAIPKSKGIEFGSLLNQLGVMVYASPYSPATRKLLLEIAPDCKERLPKRKPKKPEPAPEPEAAAEAQPASTPAQPAASDGQQEKKPAAEKKTTDKKQAVPKQRPKPALRPAAKKKASAPKGKTAQAAAKKTPSKRPVRRKPR